MMNLYHSALLGSLLLTSSNHVCDLEELVLQGLFKATQETYDLNSSR
jgi:hypothetical protein